MQKYDFVNDPPKEMFCKVCRNILNKPHLTDCCGQHFCHDCIKGKEVCPSCKKSFSHILYIQLQRKIETLDVYCPYRKWGCQVVCRLGDMNSHKDGCHIKCPNGCGKRVLGKDRKKHCGNDCAKRKSKCRYCDKEDYFEVIIGEHATVCENYPVSCPNQCNQTTELKRKDLLKHIEVCPLESVHCPFNYVGCKASVLRKELDAHIEANTQQHLLALAKEHYKLLMEHTRMKGDLAAITGMKLDPVTLSKSGDSFIFSISTIHGWISPEFYVLDGYKMYIKCEHESSNAYLYLLMGENDDKLKWPISLSYKIIATLKGTQCRTEINLSTNEHNRVITGHSRRVQCITMPIQYKQPVKHGKWVSTSTQKKVYNMEVSLALIMMQEKSGRKTRVSDKSTSSGQHYIPGGPSAETNKSLQTSRQTAKPSYPMYTPLQTTYDFQPEHTETDPDNDSKEEHDPNWCEYCQYSPCMGLEGYY